MRCINAVSVRIEPRSGLVQEKEPGRVSSSTPIDTRFCWPAQTAICTSLRLHQVEVLQNLVTAVTLLRLVSAGMRSRAA